MVVLCASVCTKAGNVLFARQFVQMGRVRVEGLIAAFPKLVGPTLGMQHTHVETEDVRYVYLPLEQLYMVLITTKSSNILEDLDTLHLLSKLVLESCKGPTEAEVLDKAFELTCAIDEVLHLGYKEKLTLPQVKTLLEMESHEEKIFDMVARNKEREADEQKKRRIMEMEREKKEAKAMGLAGGPGGRYGGISAATYQPPPAAFTAPAAAKPESPRAPPPSALKGMQLGAKKGKSSGYLEALKQEGEYNEVEAAPTFVAPPVSTVAHQGVHVKVAETVHVSMRRDGSLIEMEVKGAMSLIVSDAAQAKIRIAVTKVSADWRSQTHPHIDKKLYQTESILGLKDPSKSFPTGEALQILRWGKSFHETDDIPLNINCWPSSGDVNVEYELKNLDLVLTNVVIRIPLTRTSAPAVGEASGSYQFLSGEALEWHLPIIDKDNATGSLEFNNDGSADSDYFPVSVEFNSEKTFAGLKVEKVSSSESGAPAQYSSEVSLATDIYEIQDE